MPILVKCEVCGKEKYMALSAYKKNKHKKFFCNHKCIGEYIKIEEHKITKKKYKEGDVLGCYKLLKFHHRKNADYYWEVECIKCGAKHLRKLSSKGMKNSKFCKSCVKEKYVNYKTPEEYIKAKTIINKNGCWLWTGFINKKTGYAQSKYRSVHMPAHQFSYKTFKGPISKGMCVCHTCDIRQCVNPDHLFLGNQKDNALDMVEKGRDLHGEKAPSNKLKEYEVLEIIKLRKEGKILIELAKKFNVSISTISHICNRDSWKYLDNK